jgi:hypothetical protein
MLKTWMIVGAWALVCLNANAEESPVKVQIHLSPAGGFVAQTSDIKGFVTVNGAGYTGRNILVNLKHLKTGIELRDKHTQKHLETDKYPDAVLMVAQGKGGKGKAKLRIHGKEIVVSGTYEVKGPKLLVKFPVHLADVNITGIKYMGVGVKDDVEIEILVPISKTTSKN